MDKSNKHGQEAEMLSSSVLTFKKYASISLEKKSTCMFRFKEKRIYPGDTGPPHNWGLKDNGDNLEIKNIWHNKNAEFGRVTELLY